MKLGVKHVLDIYVNHLCKSTSSLNPCPGFLGRNTRLNGFVRRSGASPGRGAESGFFAVADPVIKPCQS